MLKNKLSVCLIAFLVALTGCNPILPASGASPTSVQPLEPTETIQTLTQPEPKSLPSVWVDPNLPTGFTNVLPELPLELVSSTSQAADLLLQPAAPAEAAVRWIFALVAPFPTVVDGISFSDLKSLWAGEAPEWSSGKPLLVSPSTRHMFEQIWGKAGPGALKELPEDSLLETAWSDQPSWALIPFEQIAPRWKVLRIDGISPLDKEFDPDTYPLSAGISLQGPAQTLSALGGTPLAGLLSLPASNRDPQKMSVLVMTGVTALVRATGAKMEKLGMTYPARDIQEWLRDADLTHISNEVSFEPTCPPANPYTARLMFCSRPEYLELLEFVGADVIELTGNHLKDWRYDSFEYTLELYRDHGLHYYGGGWNLEEARRPLLIEHNGNRLAFIGCNPAGPETVWATDDSPGAASCDYEQMKAEIGRLQSEGYLVIASLQYNEHYAMVATPYQQRDYPPLAEAGAAIVSGSQAHFAQTMTFVGDSFVHYGLGNLFFDQMDVPVKGTRREFIDRHVFYEGRYLGVELLTAMLEDYSKPRPMTDEERAAFLQDAFNTAVW